MSSSPDYARWRDTSDTAYWGPLDVTPAFSRLDIAGWHLAGWYDVFCESTLAAFSALSASAASAYARRSQRLVVGPWTHVGIYQQAGAEVDFGLAGSGQLQALPEEMRDFLRGAIDRKEVKGGVSVFVMGRNEWRELDAWPPASAEMVVHLDGGAANGLAGDGTLVFEPPATPRRDHFRHDPADPVPTRGGRTLNPVLPPAGPLDQRAVEGRPDVLAYTSAPLRRDLTVIGTVTASIAFASSAVRADVTVKLCDVHPDGRSINIVDGVRRVDLTPGRRRAVVVRVGSTAMVFKRGHRLRVEVASSNFPRLDLLPAADQTVFTGGARPASYLTLPLAVS